MLRKLKWKARRTSKLRRDWRHFSLLYCKVKESEPQKERGVEDREIDGSSD